MPFSRDPRLDRRRRLMRETFIAADGNATDVRSRSRRALSELDDSELQPRRSAGYSQNVRRECQQRLVQLIPVRRRAYLSTILVSLLLPTILLTAHYFLFVSPSRWQSHPLATLFDANHPRGIGAWFCSQLWLLCLAATVLTFRLRRHKLDDYDGEYRLWFWLVSTCLVGSLDSTTRVSELFGNALDRWSQLNLGWSGNAVVSATLATLVGMLGLRLCTELKTVPTSLVFWLVGLLAWAGSAALGQAILKVDISLPLRMWLRSALWIGGLTCIWLSALAYLRYVYIEAQRRFLLRGKLSASLNSTWHERLTESMPKMPAMPKLPSFRLRPPVSDDADSETGTPVNAKSRLGWGPKKTKPTTNAQIDTPENLVASPIKPSVSRDERSTSTVREERSPVGNQERPAPPLPVRRPATAQEVATGKPAASENQVGENTKRSWLSRFARRPKNTDDAPEYRKVDKQRERTQTESSTKPASKTLDSKAQVDSGQAAESIAKKRGWFSKLKMPKVRLPKLSMPKLPRPKLPKLSMPRIKLPSLRLPPPESSGTVTKQDGPQPSLKVVNAARPLPSTSGPTQEAIESGARPLSKAERKRLKRIQDEQESQRRAA